MRMRRGACVGPEEKYRIEGALGDGGFGDTYRAVNQSTGARVALKFLDSDSFDKAKQEGGSAVGTAHENVVKVLDVVNWERPFVVMEFVDGESLSDYLDQNAPLPPPVWWQTLKPLLSGLHHLHATGLVHRDIKPDNIILRDHNPQRPVIVDFGAARKRDEKLSQVIITPLYADPEIQQTNFKKPVASWDIYSLAVVSFEALFWDDFEKLTNSLESSEAHENMKQHLLGQDSNFFQAIGKGLERMDQRPSQVVDWLAMMVEPSAIREEHIATASKHTVASKCREIEQTYRFPERSIQLTDAHDEPVDGRASLISFWKSRELSIDYGEDILKDFFDDDDTVKSVRDSITNHLSYPDNSVRLVNRDGEPYNGNTKVKTVRKDFSE